MIGFLISSTVLAVLAVLTPSTSLLIPPYNAPRDGDYFHLVASKESSASHLGCALDYGGGIEVHEIDGTYFLTQGFTPTNFYIRDGNLRTSSGDKELISGELLDGQPITLSTKPHGHSDFGWMENLLRVNVTAGKNGEGVNGFVICRAPGGFGGILYWNGAGSNCDGAFGAVQIHAIKPAKYSQEGI